MIKPWRIAVFSIFFFTAALTPTGDPVTMGALALPLTILYFGACGLSIFLDKRRGKDSPKIADDESEDIEPAKPIDEV